MGKRSRKRPSGPVSTVEPAAPPRPRPSPQRRPGQSRVDRFIERADERPKPPWHPVPLVELSVLVGIVLIVIGLINHDSSKGRIAVAFGLALASLAGLDTAAREHFAGFRSHSTLLAGVPAVLTVAVLALAHVPTGIVVAAGAVVFAAGLWRLRRAFAARAGVAFKV